MGENFFTQSVSWTSGAWTNQIEGGIQRDVRVVDELGVDGQCSDKGSSKESNFGGGTS